MATMTITFSVPKGQEAIKEWLEQRSKAEGVSKSKLIMEALMKEREARDKEAFNNLFD